MSRAMGQGLWIAWPKKASALASDISETEVRAAGLANGLVDYKVCAINETWSGLKFTAPDLGFRLESPFYNKTKPEVFPCRYADRSGMSETEAFAMPRRTGPAAFLIVTVTALLAAQSRTAEYPIRSVPLDQVQITGGFWRPRLETNRTITIPHILQQNETTGRVDNLRRGARKLAGEYQGRRFNDTDVYKIIEAAAYTLVSHPDPALSTKLDELIALIAASQQPDGYVFPARTINPAKPAAGVGTERFIHENTGSHELYNFGHLYEAAVAHAAATKKRTLMDVAVKNADLVRKTFGPAARRDAPGHQEIELALVRLYQATNDRRYSISRSSFSTSAASRTRRRTIQPIPTSRSTTTGRTARITGR